MHTSDSITLRGELTKIWRKKFWVITITLAAAILGYSFSLPWFTPVEYLSTAIIVPPNFNMVKSTNFQPGPYHGPGIATDEDLERLTHALNSDTVTLSLARQFDLFRRYEIDPELSVEKQYKKLKSAISGKITIKLSRFSTIEIAVYDTNAVMAREIAAALVQRADSIVETVAQRREGLASVTHQLQQLDSVIGYLSANLGRSGPTPLGRTFDLSSQPGAYALSSTGNPSEYASIVNGEFALWQYNRIRSDLYAEYIQRKKDLENYPSYLSVVGHPAVNYDKARPNRVVVTLLCFVAGLLFSSMGVLVADRFLGQRTS